MFHRWVTQYSDRELTQKFLYETRKVARGKYKSIAFDTQAMGSVSKPLGSGSFGKVYAATYRDQRVAVKEMAFHKPSRVKMFNIEV